MISEKTAKKITETLMQKMKIDEIIILLKDDEQLSKYVQE